MTRRLSVRAAGISVVLCMLTVVLAGPVAAEHTAAASSPATGRGAARRGPVVLLASSPATSQRAARRGPVVLLASSPAPYAVLAGRPSDVVLEFDRPVDVPPLSIRILAVGGANVGAGAASHPSGRSNEVAERLSPLRPGVYLVAWRVAAKGGGRSGGAAGGGYWFTVLGAGPNAHPPTSTGNVRALLGQLDAPKPSPGLTLLSWLARLLAAAATLVLVGMGAALCLVWPEGWSRRSSIVITWAACGTLLLSTLAGVGLEGLDDARLPLSRVFSRSLYAASLRTTRGRADLAIWALVVVAGVLMQLLDLRLRQGDVCPARWWKLTAGAVGLGLLGASVLAGTGDAGRWKVVGTVADLVHVGAAAVWLGAVLVLVSAMGRASPPSGSGTIARRASRVALSAVLALAVSGGIEAARRAGSLDGLTSTGYGRLLLIKSILAGAAIFVALGGARLLGSRRSRRRPHSSPTDRLILRSALVEVFLLAGALGVTASLEGIEPAEQVLSQPYGHVFAIGTTNVNVIVDPGRVGPDNTLHIYTLRPDGAPVAILELTGVLQLPAAGIGPVKVPLVNAGLAHFIATDIDLPVAGNWQLTLLVHTGLASTVAIDATVPVH